MSGFKVRVTGPGGAIWCESTPQLSESRNANYPSYDIVHLPTDLFAYKNTSGRRFGLAAKLVSRNTKEAEAHAGYLNLARKWILPTFGGGTGIAGATPPILKLYGYNNKNLDGVHCILKQYSWDFPDEVDYIYSASEPMPVIGILRLELDEAYSAKQITAGEWKIKETAASRPSDAGGGKGSSGGPTDDFSKSNFNGTPSGGGGGSSLGSGRAISQAGGAAGSGSALLNRLQSQLSEAILSNNSSLIQELTSQISTISNNDFLSGLQSSLNIDNPQLSQALRDISSGSILSQAQNQLLDGFNRSQDFVNISTIINID